MMRITCTVFVVLMASLQVLPLLAADALPPLQQLLRLSFDGTVEAVAEDAEVTVSGDEGVQFIEGVAGQAVDLRQGGCLEYRNLPELNLESGTFEIWIKAADYPDQLQDLYYLHFLTEDGESRLGLYQRTRGGTLMQVPKAFMAVGAQGWPDQYEARSKSGDGIIFPESHERHRWTHIAVTWDNREPNPGGLQYYIHGGRHGYTTPWRPIRNPEILRVGCDSPQRGHYAMAALDEIAVYNRALTAPQVRLLYENGHLPAEEKWALLQQRVAEDDARESYVTDTFFNHRNFALIHGRNTTAFGAGLYNSLNLPVPDLIHETELAAGALEQYDVVLVPGGGGINLDEAGRQALLDFVSAGGGYVGICGGAMSAISYGLVNCSQYQLHVRGPIWNLVSDHPITQGYDPASRLLVAHASGPLWIPGDDHQAPFLTFMIGATRSKATDDAPDLPTFVSAIAATYAEGRVAIFSGHPESSPETHRMLRNAILWAAKVIGEEEEAGREQ